MDHIQSTSRPATLFNIGALGRRETNDAPHPEGDFTLADIKQMARTIVDNNRAERGLAIDMLVNLAVRNDSIGKDAQKVLRDVYANPGVYAEPNALGDHEKPAIRKDIADKAHDMGRFVLGGRKDNVGVPVLHPLSVTVAYLAGQSANATADDKRDIGAHLDDAIMAPKAQGEKWLGRTRMADMSQLQAASPAYGNSLPLDRHQYVSLALDQPDSSKAKADFSKAVREMANELPASQCKAVWIQSGSAGYPHWMPMVIQRASDNSLHFHVLNTDKRTEHRDKEIRARLEVFFTAARLESGDAWGVHIDSHAMQTHAGHSCGLLGHNLFKDLAAALKESPDKAGSADVVRGLIDGHCTRWNVLEPEDVHAVVFGTHAELLQARADTGLDERGMDDEPLPSPKVRPAAVPGEPEPGAGEAWEPGSTSPIPPKWAVPGLTPGSMDSWPGSSVAAPAGAMVPDGAPPLGAGPLPMPIDAPPGVLPPSGERLPNDLQKAVSSLNLHTAKTSEGTSYYASSLSSFATSYNDIGKIKGLFNQSAAIAKAPEDSRKLMAALLNFEETIKVLDGNSPLFGTFLRDDQFKAFCTELGDSKLSGLVSHVSANMKDLVSDLVKLAMNADTKDLTAQAKAKAMQSFNLKLDEIPRAVKRLIDRVTNAIKQLEKLHEHSRNDIVAEARQWGTASMGDRQAHDDARKLLDRLTPLKEAMMDPSGVMQKLSKFAENASTYPSEVAAAIRQEIASAPVAEVVKKPVEKQHVQGSSGSGSHAAANAADIALNGVAAVVSFSKMLI